jgi:uncharacterized damage-inducible protein DinB
MKVHFDLFLPNDVMISRVRIVFLILMLCALGLGLPLGAQHRPTDRSLTTGPEPPSSFRDEFLQELAFCEQRFILIAETMPADRYSWRPAQGMRSLGGLFAHVVIANYDAIEALDQGQGAQSGTHSSYQQETILAIAEDKPKILEALKSSFAQLRIRILRLSDAEGDKPQVLFNRETTVRGALMMIDRHLGQHLGQATTYALMNGVVPPWGQEPHHQKHDDKSKPPSGTRD